MKLIAPNTLIQNRYLVVQLIGKGGMGEVYLAVDQRLGSAVALKRTFFSDDEQLRYAFEREAKTLARLRHPALPKVSDHFTEEETQYLVMEHISGEDISKRLELNNKAFPLSWVLFWADHLLDALTYLHNHEPPIIHRDIKPQNLKLTDENNIILLDFGLSKSSVGETKVLSTGSIVGYTPHYAPMEQIRGTGTDPRSDIYALSATLYQILTNVIPSDALTRADALINGFDEPIRPLYLLNPEVPKSISDIIFKGMSVSQDKRYSSARDMQKELRDAFTKSQTETFSHSAAGSQVESSHEIARSQFVTEVGEKPAPVMEIPPASEVFSAPANVQSASGAVNLKSLEIAENGSDDTNAQSSFSSENPESDNRQSDIKTEVLIAGANPEITAAQNGSYGDTNNFSGLNSPAENPESYHFADSGKLKNDENFFNTESFSVNDDFSEIDVSDAGGNFSPGATVPLFTLDSKANVNVPTSEPPLFEADEAVNYDEEVDYGVNSDEVENAAFAEVAKPAALRTTVPPKKSAGKMYAVLGGLVGLLILSVGAVALFVFLSGDKPAVTKDLPTPTPEAIIEVTPSPEQTLETVVNDLNTNANAETGPVDDLATETTNDNDSGDKTSASNSKQGNVKPNGSGKRTERLAEQPNVVPPPPLPPKSNQSKQGQQSKADKGKYPDKPKPGSTKTPARPQGGVLP